MDGVCDMCPTCDGSEVELRIGGSHAIMEECERSLDGLVDAMAFPPVARSRSSGLAGGISLR